MKVSELKLTQVELFLFLHFKSLAANCFMWPCKQIITAFHSIPIFHFNCAAANVSKSFCMAHLAKDERFSYYSNLSVLITNFIYLQTR